MVLATGQPHEQVDVVIFMGAGLAKHENVVLHGHSDYHVEFTNSKGEKLRMNGLPYMIARFMVDGEGNAIRHREIKLA